MVFHDMEFNGINGEDAEVGGAKVRRRFRKQATFCK
jgi:hypothetical protein